MGEDTFGLDESGALVGGDEVEGTRKEWRLVRDMWLKNCCVACTFFDRWDSECHKHAPITCVDDDDWNDHYATWPPVDALDFCGDIARINNLEIRVMVMPSGDVKECHGMETRIRKEENDDPTCQCSCQSTYELTGHD